MKPNRRILTMLFLSVIGMTTGEIACGRTGPGDSAHDDAGGGGTSGAEATGGVASSSGIPSAGGVPSLGGTGGRLTSNDAATGGGTTGAGGSGGNLAIHECQILEDAGPPPRDICFFCDPLPAGSTGGCGVPIDCNTTDLTSPLRYPVGCQIVFPWHAMFSYEVGRQTASCWESSPGIMRWQCAW
jgi:hypothetical protein